MSAKRRLTVAVNARKCTVTPNDEVERPRDDLWRAADIVVAEGLDIVRLALYASRIAPTDC